MSDTHRFSVSVAAVIRDDEGRYLLIKRRDNGHWEPPGGVVEPEEKLEEAVVRETLEETGLEVEPIGLTGVYQNLERAIVSLVFECQVRGGTERITDESTDLRWSTASEVQSLADEAYAVRLLDASDGKVKVRSHDGVSVITA